MNLTVESTAFAEAVRRCSSAMSKVNLAILTTIRLEAEGDSLTLRGTDMEQAMRVTVDAVVKEPGIICLSAERLRNFQAPEGSEISITLAGNQAKIKAGGRRMTLPWLGPQDFPVIDEPVCDVQIEAESAAVETMLDMTEFAIDQSKMPRFGGVCLRPKGGKLCAVASNSKILSEYVSGIACPDFPWITVPRAFIPAMRAALHGRVIVGVSATRLVIFSERATFTCRLLDQKFIEYERVLPTEIPLHFALNAKAIGDELGRAISFAGDRDSTIYISAADAVRMHAGGQERFDAEIPLAAPIDRLFFATNGRQLKAICDVCGDSEITISPAITNGASTDTHNAIIVRSPEIGGLTIMQALCASNESNFREEAAA